MTRSSSKPGPSTAVSVNLPFRESKRCPVEALTFDLENPRLQTGIELSVSDDTDLIRVLADIAALDELVLSICTNTYLNLEPLIVHGRDGGPYKVLEGNRRLAAIRLIRDQSLAREVGVDVPSKVPTAVLKSIEEVLVFRVRTEEEAREFIGFKHINGPQRWDAYAKARYVTEWYRKGGGRIGIDEIAAKMGDNNNTLRSFIYAILALDQAQEAGKWSLSDRPPARGRFAFSHLYTALNRTEYQEYLGLTGAWSNNPPIKPIKRQYLDHLGEVLTYLYGSVSDGRTSLIRSQNPDLKDLGLAIADPRARLVLQSRGGTLEKALDELKEPASAFHESMVAVKLRLQRAIDLFPKYTKRSEDVDDLIEEVYTQADMLKTMNEKNRRRSRS